LGWAGWIVFVVLVVFPVVVDSMHLQYNTIQCTAIEFDSIRFDSIATRGKIENVFWFDLSDLFG